MSDALKDLVVHDPDDIELVDGVPYSRWFTRQLAGDIEILSQVAPNSWTIANNSALQVVQPWVLSCAAPVLHRYIVDIEGLSEEALSVVEEWGRNAGYQRHPNFHYIWMQEWDLSKMALLESGHRNAIKKLPKRYESTAAQWRTFNETRWDAIRRIVGRELPKPGFYERWRDHRNHQQTPDHLAGRRYWRLSAGPQGKHWPTMRDHGFLVEENWSNQPVVLDELPSDRLAFLDAIRQFPVIGESSAQTAWNVMHAMSVGDLIVAEKNRKVYGWGVISGEYEYQQDLLLTENPNSHPHRRPVDWHEIDPPVRLSSPSDDLQKTLDALGVRELSRSDFEELIALSPIHQNRPNGSSLAPLNAISRELAQIGLTYTSDQISAFYTGLQTKGFVVLSGISGTGKSKIATGFVDLLPEGLTSSSRLPAQPDRIPLTVKPYMQKYRRVIFPKASLDLLPPLAVGEQREIQLTLGDIHGSGRIEHRAHSGGSSITVLYFRGSIGNAIANLKSDSKLFAEPVLDADGDRLASIRLTTEQERSETGIKSEPVSNHLFLSVRPDWRDSTSLLGYYNPLAASYEWTDFLRFVLQAVDNYKGPVEDQIAWFVILDEMNLAHVEYYFADLLSVIESGRNAEGWTSEPLRFSYPETLEDDEVPPREVNLPPNLYIIGTVNMDETTHAFSPKVLDRAFTIELTDVSFEDYPPTISDPGHESALNADQKQTLLRRFARDGTFAVIDKVEIAAFVADHPEVRDWLQSLNSRLATYRLHFGYRVFDEIVQYLANNESDADVPLKDAFDQAVLMKVLPKFTGSRARLEDPLREVLHWTIDPDEVDRLGTTELLGHWTAGTSIAGILQGSSLHRTARRVAEMLATLERDGFVSFG